MKIPCIIGPAHIYSGSIEAPSQYYSAETSGVRSLEELSAVEMKHREFLAKSIAGTGGLLPTPGNAGKAGQKSTIPAKAWWG